MEEFGVKKMSYVSYGSEVLSIFFFDPCSLSGHNLAIRPPN